MSSTSSSLTAADAEKTGRLTGKLGPIAIAFMVIAAAAPLTIFITTPLNMLASNGAGISFDYLAGPLLLLVFAGGFAAMTMHVKKAGAFYSYITAALGRRVGVGAGFTAMGGYFIMQSFVFALMGVTINETITQYFGTEAFNLPWWAWMIIGIVIVAWLGAQNIDLSAKVLGVALVLEVVVVLVIDLAILIQGGGPEGISVTSAFTPDVIFSGPIGLGLLFGLSVGLGFEATAIFRDEARDPAKTIPRAIYITVIGAAVFYCFATWAFIQAYGVNGVMDAVSEDPINIVYTTATQWVGVIFADVIRILAITSMFACVLAYHNIASRYLHSLGHSVLPAKLAKVHGTKNSPYVASIAASVVALVVAIAWTLSGIDPMIFISWEIAMGTVAILVLFVLTSVSIFIFFRKRPDLDNRLWATKLSPIISFFLIGAIMVTALINFGSMAASEDEGLNMFLRLVPFILFGVGVVVATIAKKRNPRRYSGLDDHGQATDRIATVGADLD